MPFRRGFRRMNRRKSYKRKYSRNNRLSTPRSITPNSIMVKMKQSGFVHFNFIASDTLPVYVVVQGNDLHTDSYIGTGNAVPAGYSQLFDLYDSYCVRGAKFLFTCCPGSDTGSEGFIFGLVPSRTNTAVGAASTLQELLNYSRSKWALIPGGRAGPGVRSLKHYVSTTRMLATNRDDPDIRAAAGSTPTSPASHWFMNLFARPVAWAAPLRTGAADANRDLTNTFTDQSNATDASECFFALTVTYYVEFLQRKVLV